MKVRYHSCSRRTCSVGIIKYIFSCLFPHSLKLGLNISQKNLHVYLVKKICFMQIPWKEYNLVLAYIWWIALNFIGLYLNKGSNISYRVLRWSCRLHAITLKIKFLWELLWRFDWPDGIWKWVRKIITLRTEVHITCLCLPVPYPCGYKIARLWINAHFILTRTHNTLFAKFMICGKSWVKFPQHDKK